MSVPEYDLFCGIFDKNAMWLEAVEGLGNAFERMKDLASEAPGSYFVFCTRTHQVMASVDTSVQAKNQENRSGSASA